MLKVLDLFSGIGGFSLGLHRAGGFETVAFCEIDPFCQKVLAKNFPEVEIFSDIKKLNSKDALNGKRIDVICGGFPCQPFSNAGKKKGRQDDRDLWPEMFRVINEIKPTWVIGENVAGFIGMEFTRTKVNLESIGYKVQPFIIPACAVGAQHRRDRVWIIAHLDSDRHIEDSLLQARNQDPCLGDIGNGEEELTSNTDNERRKVPSSGKLPTVEINRGTGTKESSAIDHNRRFRRNHEANSDFGNWWADQSGMGRIVYGFSTRVDKYRRNRVKALGNSIVPGIVEIIGKAILKDN